MVVVVCVCDEQFLAVAWGEAGSPAVAWLRRLWPVFAVLYATSVPHTHTHTQAWRWRLGDGAPPSPSLTARPAGDGPAWR